MTEHGSQNPPVEGAVAEPEATETPSPPPEPWTPRRVSEWNSYYDIYVAAFVLLLAFLGAVNKIQPTNAGLWSLLDAGRRIASSGPLTGTDTASIAGEGLRWTNIPWLFEVVHYKLYSIALSSLTPTPEPGTNPAVATAQGEQRAAGTLIILSALVRLATALLLLGLRRKGPGLWWTALCVALALGVTLSPSATETITAPADPNGEVIRVTRPAIATSLGGVAGPASVAPATWGLMFLAVELLLIHGATNLGKPSRLYSLIPLFLIWANVDESFGFGLALLAAMVLGLALGRKSDPTRPTLRLGLIVLGSSLAATFANPSHVFGVLAGFGTMLRSIGISLGPPSLASLSIVGGALAKDAEGYLRSYQIYYVALVGMGLASFALNRRNFSADRLAIFAAAAILWGLALAFSTPFAAVLVFALALNGQEWYQDTFGTEGRLGAGWVFWSTGGRVVTIALVFLAVFRATTGWGSAPGDPVFGLGYNADDFPFEAADALKKFPIVGNVLNTTATQGDAIAWRDAGKPRPFVDGRQHLYPREVFEKLAALRRAIKDDRVEAWQPELDASKVSAVMIQVSGDPVENSPLTYARLMSSPNWIPFHDDGSIVIFGRADAKVPPADLAYFRANKLDADEMAYRRPTPIPSWERPPTATSELIDSVFQNRLNNRPQPHTVASAHWLNPVGIAPGTRYLPDPAHCLLAVREARTALTLKPDDPNAFARLADAYRLLLIQESALIAAIPLTPENATKILQTPNQLRLLSGRTRQLLTAMNFTIQTLPPPKTPNDRVERAQINYAMALLYIQNGALDLARERLTTDAIDVRVGEMPDGFIQEQAQRLGELTQRIDAIQSRLTDLVMQRRASPQEKANEARFAGAPGIAIRELKDAEDAGGNLAGIRPALVDLYCDTGQPELALDVIGPLDMGDPSLGSGVGTASYRQGRVYLLLGNYDYAITLWRDRAIAEVRRQRAIDATTAGQLLLTGSPEVATRKFLDLPEKVALQAEWEFELGMAALESGAPPKLAAEHLQAALKLEPNLGVRPVIAYYLEKLGEEVPPLKAPEPAPSPAPSPAAAEAPKPAETPPASAPATVPPAGPAGGGEPAPKP